MSTTTTAPPAADPTIRVNSALIRRAAVDPAFHARLATNLEQTGRADLLPGFFAAVHAAQSAGGAR